MGAGGYGGSQYGMGQQYDPYQAMQGPPQSQMYGGNLGSMGSAYGSAANNQMAGQMGGWQPPPSWQGQFQQPQAMPSSVGALLGAQPGFSNMMGQGSLDSWWANAAPWQQEMFPQYGPDQQLTDMSTQNTLQTKPGGMPAQSTTYPSLGSRGQEGGGPGSFGMQELPGGSGPGLGQVAEVISGMSPGAQAGPQETNFGEPTPFDAYQARELRGIE
jgi:hypothetical protein